jgi:hypothetical protein
MVIPTRIDNIPDNNRFGTIVKTGKQACQTVSGWQGGPMALINKPSVGALSCKISKTPYSIPIKPA